MMKKLLFILSLSLTLSLSAQVKTITIDWTFGSNSNATGANNNADRTIEIGDTVIWNWTATGTHNVNRTGGTSSDSFTSSFFSTGGTFSHTFTSLGTNVYQCDPHPGSMFGVITVQSEGTLSTPDFVALTKFSIYPNPSSDVMNISIPTLPNEGLNLEVYDILGKKVYSEQITKLSSEVNIAEWNSGLYLVKLSSTNQNVVLTNRFVKL